MPSSECSQGVGDDGQINPFLKHRARGRREDAERRHHHCREAQEHSGDDALTRDGHGAAADGHRVRDPVQSIDHHDGGGGLGRDRSQKCFATTADPSVAKMIVQPIACQNARAEDARSLVVPACFQQLTPIAAR